jgi:putative SOS response-associated peptidase YedK
MCGRYYLSRHVLERLNRDAPNLFAGLEAKLIDQLANGDVRPSTQVLTIATGPKMQLARWGWRRNFDGRDKDIINATVEKLSGRFWGGALKARRCVVIAQGFYEWTTRPDRTGKSPVAIQTLEPGPMLMAGVWDDSEEHGPCVSIVTTEAPGTMGGIHARCPALLNKAGMEKWLDAATTNEEALALIKPYAGEFAIWGCGGPTRGTIPEAPTPGNDSTREAVKHKGLFSGLE